jgi:hypothetical protein
MSGSASQAAREYAQLLRAHDRTRRQLQDILEDLSAPGTQNLLREIRRRTGDTPQKGMAEVVSAVEEALRVLQLAESETGAALQDGKPSPIRIDGIDNLPARLGRFLAERRQLPGFTYEVEQDDVRGWIVKWEEFTTGGEIRGFGQFYERPYAWIDD